MSEEKIKQCPFCGGEAGIAELLEGGWIIGCKNKSKCIVYPSVHRPRWMRLDAIKAWNTRTIEDELEEYKFMYKGQK